MKKHFVQPVEAAEYLGIAKSTLAKKRLAGNGPPYSKRGGKLVLYEVAALDKWVKDGERLSTSDAA